MRNSCLALTAILSLATASANAADLSQPNVTAPPMSTGSVVPNSDFFLGLGASANWTNFGHQHVYAIGTSNVFTDGVLSASGNAQGPTNIHMEDRFSFAPSFQGGYFQRFGASDWLWGAKLSYNYLGATSTNTNSIIPQFGSFTTIVNPTPVPFSGPAYVARRSDKPFARNRPRPLPWSCFRSKLHLCWRRSDALTNSDQVEWPGGFCVCRWRDRGSVRRAPGLLELELAHWRCGGCRRHLFSDSDLVSRFELHLRHDGRPHLELCEPIYRSQFDERWNIGRQLRLEGGDTTRGAHDQQGVLRGPALEGSC
jgi:hypothetical protein